MDSNKAVLSRMAVIGCVALLLLVGTAGARGGRAQPLKRDSGIPHQPGDPLDADVEAIDLGELGTDARSTVGPVGHLVDGLDARGERGVLSG